MAGIPRVSSKLALSSPPSSILLGPPHFGPSSKPNPYSSHPFLPSSLSFESFHPLQRDDRIQIPVPDAFFLNSSKPLEQFSSNLSLLIASSPAPSGDTADRRRHLSPKDASACPDSPRRFPDVGSFQAVEHLGLDSIIGSINVANSTHKDPFG
ncbi:hypothetical protein Nepgr_032339 [Nepenthes gracilis]|uniref:Uncharacterized protein n=1 Tax=Nepenthes gracilis TaxID=150966 RepID=A0AAD3Y878_NEPGR|nr:hypothetical protein Nepgr_032339 [Nepenthes gracilis]